MYIGENLKRIRTEKGLTQKQLADVVGCSENAIQQYESNVREPRNEMMLGIANALEIRIAELIGKNYELPPDIQKLLSSYRELYDEEQHYNEEHYIYPFKQLSDEVLLMIALDEAIATEKMLTEG